MWQCSLHVAELNAAEIINMGLKLPTADDLRQLASKQPLPLEMAEAHELWRVLQQLPMADLESEMVEQVEPTAVDATLADLRAEALGIRTPTLRSRSSGASIAIG